MNREPIYSALFAKISQIEGFNTVSRRLKHWDDVTPSEQPALFQSQKSEAVSTVPGMNPVWEFHLDLYLYARSSGDPFSSPAIILNPLIDSVVAALAPDPISNKQTLGGLVQHCWIEGAIETDEGVLGDQAVAIIPIVMKVV
jgi:hypothetical protein